MIYQKGSNLFNAVSYTHLKSLIFFAISILLGIILSAYVIQTYKKNCAKVQLYSEISKCIKMSYKRSEERRVGKEC